MPALQRFSAASSLACTPPKPPLLMHSTWSPGCAARATARTRASMSVGDDRLAAHRRQRGRRVPAQVSGVAEGQVGFFQCPRQQRRHVAALHRVRARLEDRQDALQADLAAQAVDGRVHGGRVVREVVVDGDAAGLAADLQPPAHVAKAGQRRCRGLGVHAHVLGGGDRGQRVELVVLAQQRPVDVAELQAAAQHVEVVRVAARAQHAGLVLARAEQLHLAPAAALEHALQSPRRGR